MKQKLCILILSLFLFSGSEIKVQPQLMISKGLKVIVVQKDFPLLKVLLPNQPNSDRGIEIEFPEHVTGLNQKNNKIEQLYFVSKGSANKRTLPTWRAEGNSLIYESDLDNKVSLIATARLEANGLRYTYKFINHSDVSYLNLQAVTCVKLYSVFSDSLLQRTYVHHSDGFELMASETPNRLTIPLQKWLPCRYLVSYNWDVPSIRSEKDSDSVTRYYKSRKADKPFIATLSHDKSWIAATYTKETGNLWTNPERSCQHADPAINLGAGETKSLELKTIIIKGNPEQLLKVIDREIAKN
ncbi:hypothetical protein [Dyadobacter sp. NIV53]|uniref:hypothetical protein n=1 Tax=Dyadobacter sp. NIV53 TaxID=2861765 RepID=UPI001C88D15B|nr:hypothetical protein [Dyadobacter sp. NIV53]